MKKICTLVFALLILSTALSVASCGAGKQAVIDLGGGTLPNTANATFEDIIRMVPTREGYAFVGWYSDAAFTDRIYPTDITKEQKSTARAFAKWTGVAIRTYDVRASETTVTDSGRQNQAIDAVYLAGDYNFSDLRTAGYRQLRVTVIMDIAEVADGYQHVFLYRSEVLPDDSFSIDSFLDEHVFGDAPDDPNLLYNHKNDYGGDGITTEWSSMTFTTSVPVDQLENTLYLRYGASGKDEDTWMNKNVQVIIEPIK